jgi:O-antigen/teichoic acid export membrane protein
MTRQNLTKPIEFADPICATANASGKNRGALKSLGFCSPKALRQVMSSKGALALCDQGVVSLGNFLTGLALGRLVGRTELGLYALCWTIVSITTDLSGALTTTPYTVFGPHLRESERGRYVGNMFVLQLAISVVIAALIGIAAGIFATERMAPGMFRALISTAAVIALLNGREFVRRIFFADMAIEKALILDVVFTSVHLFGLFLLWKSRALNASTVYLFMGAAALGQILLWAFIYRNKISVGKDALSQALRNWQFAKWVLGSSLLWTIATYLYPWLLAAYHGTMSAGLWASCSAVVAVGNPVMGGLVNYLGPRLSILYARSGLEPMRQYVYKSSGILVLILCPFALALSFFGERIMTGLYGPKYAGAQTILIFLSMNLLALSFSQPYSRGLFTLNAAKADMLINVVAVMLLFAVGVMAVSRYSVAGAASALLLSTVVTAVIRFAVFARSGESDAMFSWAPMSSSKV